MEKKRSDNIAYICFWEKAKERSLDGEISVTDFVLILLQSFHIKKKYVYPIIKEMEQDGFLERINRRTLKVVDLDIDLEDTSQLFNNFD